MIKRIVSDPEWQFYCEQCGDGGPVRNAYSTAVVDEADHAKVCPNRAPSNEPPEISSC